jgi:cytochrome c biogenesis protein
MSNGTSMTEFIPPAQKYSWQESNVSIGVINTKSLGEAVKEVKVWFSDSKGKTSSFWVDAGEETIIEGSEGNFNVQVKQLYSTGLQVAKDPGVWIVYTGFGFMMIGLYIAFFMSHRKLFVYIREEEDHQTHTLWGGTAHKNKAGFEKTFSKMVEEFRKTTI